MAFRDISAYTRPRYIESPKSQTIYAGALLTPYLARDYNVLSWSNIDENNSFYELQVCNYPILLTNENYQGSIQIQDANPNPTITFPANPNLYDSYVINKSTNGEQVVYKDGTYYFDTEVICWDGTQWVKLWCLYQEYADDDYDGIIAPQTSLALRFDLPDGWYQFRIRSSAYIQDPDDFEIRRFYSQWSNVTEAFEVKTLETPHMNDVNGTSQYYITNVDSDADFIRVFISKDSNVASYQDYTSDNIPSITNPIQLDYNEAGSYVIRAAAYSNQQFYFHQSHTNSLVDRKTYTVIKLNPPVVDDNQFEENPHPTIVWSAVDNASGYNVFLNDNAVYYDLSALTYSFLNLEPSSNHRAWVVATKSGQYQTETLDSTTHTIIRKTPLYNNPKYLDSVMSSLKVGDTIYPERPTVFGILPTPIIHMNDTPGRDNEIIIDNWSDFSGASGFRILDNGNTLTTIESTTNTYAVETDSPRIFVLQVQGTSDSDHMSDSLLSNIIRYEVLRLGAPLITISSNDGNFATITWSPVSNASQYYIYDNGTLRYTTSSTEFRVELDSGRNSIYVVSGSPYYRFLDSVASNVINVTKDSQSQYIISIEGKDYEIQLPFTYRETLDETLDSAGISTIPIDENKPFEAYCPVEVKGNYVLVEPIVNQETGKILGATTKYEPMVNFPKYMLISKDDVEEVQIGEGSKYVHHINLIERTKLLQCELMPDFSISQPLDYVIAKNNINIGQAQVDRGNHLVLSSGTSDDFGNVQVLGAVNYSWIVTYHSARFAYMGGLNNAGVSGSLKDLLYNDVEISLPYESATSFNVGYLRMWHGDITNAGNFFTGLADDLIFLIGRSYGTGTIFYEYATMDVKNSLYDYDIKLRKTYKYRRHTDTYEEDPNYPETTIGEYYDGVEHKWKPHLDLNSYPSIDIILEVDMSDEDYAKLRQIMSDLTVESAHIRRELFNNKPEFMYDGDLTDYKAIKMAEGLSEYRWDVAGYEWEPGSELSTEQNAHSPSDYFSKSKKYRIVWKNIVVSNLTNYDDTHIIREKSKSIYYALDKALNLVQPIGSVSERKYELDPRLKYLDSKHVFSSGQATEYNDYPCPEMSFTGQKSLYEVLHEIGRLFYGIPRLGCYDDENIWHDNMITFDKLDEETQATFEEVIDANTLEDTESSIDNHSTGFISNLSNVVTNDYYMSYPAGDVWTTCRTNSDMEPLTTHDNMSLIVDQPIYRIIDVLITNYRSDDPNKVLSIRNYVNESQIYASLNNNYEGKGLSLSYKQGSNVIEGLGKIPEASSWYAALGFSHDYYIIQNILHYADALSLPDAGGSYMKDPSEFRYKVLYVPYISGKVYTEQSNIAGLKYHNYKALNQEVAVISDSGFGQSAQTQVERLGNNNIKKTYRKYLDTNLPRLGMIKKFDGYNYYSDVIEYSYGNNYIDANVEFTKNFNKINERIGVDAQYRLWRIASSGFATRDIHFNNYCYISLDNYNLSSPTINNNLLSNIRVSLNNGNGKSTPVNKPDTLYIKNYKSLNEILQYNAYETGQLTDVPSGILPVSYNTYGTNISFSAIFKDNYSIGVSAADVYYPPASGLMDWEAKAQYINKDVRYVDTNGESEYIDLTLFRMNLNDSTVQRLGINPRSYPKVNTIDNASRLPNTLLNKKILLQKDTKEQLAFSYQLHFQTYDKMLRIHPGMTKRIYKTDTTYSGYEAGAGTYDAPVYVLYKGDLNRRHTLNDRVQYKVLSAPTVSVTGKRIRISSISFNTSSTYDGYALVWPDTGELLYSYKKTIPASENTQTIPPMYLNFSADKIGFKSR